MPINSPTAVEVNRVSLAFGEHRALENVSVAIPEGSYVGVVGPNGGGKTTLLKVMLGLIKPDSGTVTIFGESPEQARKSGSIGYVPQRIAQTEFPFPATVEEIVQSGRTTRIGIGRWAGTKDAAAVNHAMEVAGISHLKSRLIGSLSGGERQRAFIARSLAAEPKILILDEPTTGVDASAREQFYALLKKLNTEMKLTIVFVSHDIEVMTNEVTFVLALNQKLICHCSAHDFLSDETLKRLYGRDVELMHSHTH
jgi:zinc transport system ATP-binding protein